MDGEGRICCRMEQSPTGSPQRPISALCEAGPRQLAGHIRFCFHRFPDIQAVPEACRRFKEDAELGGGCTGGCVGAQRSRCRSPCSHNRLQLRDGALEGGRGAEYRSWVSGPVKGRVLVRLTLPTWDFTGRCSEAFSLT